MARPLRIEFPGALYHVTSRGNGGTDIVFDDRDRKRRLKWFERSVEQHDWREPLHPSEPGACGHGRGPVGLPVDEFSGVLPALEDASMGDL